MFPEIPGRKFVREREREGEGGEKGWKDRDLEITGFRGRFFGDQSGAWNRPVVSHLGRADVVGIFYRFAWRQGRNRFLRSPFSSNFSAENVSPLLLNRATRRLIVVSRSTHVSHRISSTFRFAISEVLLLRGDGTRWVTHAICIDINVRWNDYLVLILLDVLMDLNY